MSVTGLGTKRRRRSLPVVQIISVLFILAAVGVFIFDLVRFSQQQESLPAEVSVGDVNVGGLLSREALNKLESAYRQPAILYYGSSPILLDPGSVGFRMNSESMLASAGASGEVGGGFWSRFFNYLLDRESEQSVNVPLSAEFQQNLVEQSLRDISARYDRGSGQADYDLQTLTLRPGSEGYHLDVQAALPLVTAALQSATNRTVQLPVTQDSANVGNIDTLKNLVENYLDSQGFVFDGQTTIASVFIMDLKTGEEVNILGNVAFSAASTIKVAILVDYFRHLWNPVPQDEAWLMANSLLCSNNSSSNLLMKIIGERLPLEAQSTGATVQSYPDPTFNGIADVSQTAEFLGAQNTYINAPLYLGVAGQQLGSIPAPKTAPNPDYSTDPDPYNQTTAEDMGTLFGMIYDCAEYGSGLMSAYPDGEYTQTECKQMLELMSANDLLRLLQGGIPPGVRISHKNGWVNDVSGDTGIVFPPNGRDYVISVYLWQKTDFQDYTKLWPLIEGISRAAWNYFSPENPLIAPRTDLPVAAQECQGNFLPPEGQVDLNNINGWRTGQNAAVTPLPGS
jgi:Beta-lactamase enzyme family